jgi:hypothetical protein
MSYNSTTHATYLLALTTYKYNELQMSCAKIELQGQLQNTLFLIVLREKKNVWKKQGFSTLNVWVLWTCKNIFDLCQVLTM